MKGHDVFLAAARRVLAARPGARFAVVGTGPHADAVRALAGRLGLGDAVVQTGAVADPERAVAAFDVAVYPGRHSEGMGRVVFEYMAAGRAIVASRIGLAAEVLRDGESALLVEPGDDAALAGAIGAFLDDAARAGASGRACRALVEARYGGPAVAAIVEGVYRAALAGAPARARRR
jgi:glycosyltransferase involved in cell wall biosynthesis